MPRTFEARTELEAMLLEQALLMARELQATADAAPDGRVLAEAELVALRAGRELTRHALEAALQAQAQEAEKKAPTAASAPAERDAMPRAKPRKPRSRPPGPSA